MSDPRGFSYGMQALLQRVQWHFDAQQCALADAMRRQREAQDALAQLQALQRAARGGAASIGRSLDPMRARSIVSYLCHLAERIQVQAARCDDLDRECASKRRGCAEAQARLEAIEADREKALAAFRQAHARKEAVLADEQWISNWTRGGSPMAGEST